MILSFLLGSRLSSLFGLEDVNPDREEISKKAKVEIMPYIYGDLINTGYGLSVRTQKSGHTFEFAPLFAPATRGMFGNSRNRMGLTCSYYYAFFQNHSFQPYIGCSVTCLRDLSKTVMWYYDGVNPNPRKISEKVVHEQFLSPLIGVQYCSSNQKLPLYVFLDLIGPITPRFGAGVSF